MRQRIESAGVLMRPVSIVESLTANKWHLQDGPGLCAIQFEVPPGVGLTLAYYTRCLEPYNDALYGVLVDTSGDINASLDTQNNNANGSFNGNFFSNGTRFTFGPRYIYHPAFTPAWKLVVLKTDPGYSYTGGLISINSYIGATAPSGYPQIDLALVRVWGRSLTEAEIAAPTLPRDVLQQYSAAGYQPGDTEVLDEKGTGRDATLLYY